MIKATELISKFTWETKRELSKVEKKISAINISLKLLKGEKNKIARSSLIDSKKMFAIDKADLFGLVSALEDIIYR